MKSPKAVIWIVFGLLVVGGVLFVASSRAGYETAKYELVSKDGPFEIRQYEAHLVVTTPMQGGGQSGSFGKLFHYISGKNEEEMKIEMTTPVFMPASADGQPGEMQFVVPADIAKAGAPVPTDPSLKIAEMSAGKYAVLRYSGVAGEEDRKAKLAELFVAIEASGLESMGFPIHAGYDPPWTPGLLRRNEVMLRVK
jgi:SOUL heme-binding protein